jgi:integrase
MIPEAQLQAFAGFLRRPTGHRRPARERTVDEYVRAVRRSAARGDLLAESRRADCSPGYRQLCRCAAIAFGEFQGGRVMQTVQTLTRGSRWERTAARRPRVPIADGLKPQFEDEIRRLPDPWRAALELLWDGAWRLGDLLHLERRAILEARVSGCLQLEGKGGKVLSVPYRALSRPLERLTRWEWNVLHQLLGPTYGAAERRIRRLVHSVARRSGAEGPGRPVFPHLLRHTAATDMLRATKDLHLTSRLLGHGSVATTEIYLRGRPVDDVGAGIEAVRKLRRG